MTKSELIKAISSTTSINGPAVEEVLEALAIEVRMALGRGEDVTVPGLLKIGVKARPARIARNPATGATVNVPGKNVPVVKPLKSLRDDVAAIPAP